MKVEDLVKECLSNGICVSGVGLIKDEDEGKENLTYIINGFSKSGTAEIYQKDDYIMCKTRYNTYDVINSFEDLAEVAFDWNSGYCDREPFGWDRNWLPIFEKYGWVKTKTKTTTTVEIVPNN